MHGERSPRIGSRPLPKYDTSSEPAPEPAERWWLIARRSGHTMSEEELRPLKDAWEAESRRRANERTFTALQKVRAKAEELAGAARDAAFVDWAECCVDHAKDPREWTQARTLYENYLSHARRFGRNRQQRAQSVQELATETQWGRMMATLPIAKKRRGMGIYYSLRCKRTPAATRE